MSVLITAGPTEGKVCVLDIRALASAIRENARAKGFTDRPFDGNDRINTRLMLIVGELAEAQEELRAGHEPTEIYYKDGKPEGFPVELADVFIRLLDMAESLGIDLEEAVRIKHEFNLTRAFQHGGKKF